MTNITLSDGQRLCDVEMIERVDNGYAFLDPAGNGYWLPSWRVKKIE